MSRGGRPAKHDTSPHPHEVAVAIPEASGRSTHAYASGMIPRNWTAVVELLLLAVEGPEWSDDAFRAAGAKMQARRDASGRAG